MRNCISTLQNEKSFVKLHLAVQSTILFNTCHRTDSPPHSPFRYCNPPLQYRLLSIRCCDVVTGLRRHRYAAAPRCTTSLYTTRKRRQFSGPFRTPHILAGSHNTTTTVTCLLYLIHLHFTVDINQCLSTLFFNSTPLVRYHCSFRMCFAIVRKERQVVE